jgi:DNA-binding phage protein
MSTIKHNDWLFEQLKDAEFAAEFLNATSEDDDPTTYLTALRKVVEARGLQVQDHLCCRWRSHRWL